MAKQCLNKRSMVLRESGEIVTNDEGDDNTMPLLEDVSDNECIADVELTLVSRRALNMHAKEEEDEQRENIFHTRCHVRDKVCSMIIDGGSCTNVSSTMMVK